jgi:hypothetical protein
MSTVPAPGRDFGDLVRALIEEAWRRARRRRLVYGSVVALAVVATVIFATLRGPSTTGGAPLAVGGSGAPVARVATNPPHVYHGVFRLRGTHGSLAIAIAFPDTGGRWWDVISGPQFPRADPRSGQYDPLAGGHGEHVEAGGHASAWHARLVGLVIPKDRGPKQPVVIKLKGGPTGTFVLIPRKPGVLERDSGTQNSAWLG